MMKQTKTINNKINNDFLNGFEMIIQWMNYENSSSSFNLKLKKEKKTLQTPVENFIFSITSWEYKLKNESLCMSLAYLN